MNNCSTCDYAPGTRIDFIKGMQCSACGLRSKAEIVVYTHDSVNRKGELYHHYTFEKLATCQCGHSASRTSKKCKEGNSIKQTQENFQSQS